MANGKCDECGEDFIHPSVHWDIGEKQFCSPDCMIPTLDPEFAAKQAEELDG